jgi:hypothetical protein
MDRRGVTVVGRKLRALLTDFILQYAASVPRPLLIHRAPGCRERFFHSAPGSEQVLARLLPGAPVGLAFPPLEFRGA